MILLKNKDKKANIKIGNNIEIKDGNDFPFDLTLYGRSTQETTQGKQLFNYEDTTMVTDGITVDEDGWITATFDNTNGTGYKYLNFYTNNLNLKNSTTYAIVSEIKSVSGTGFLIPVSKTNTTPQTGGQFNSEVSYNFATLTNNMIKIETPTTIDDFSTTNYGLRTLLQFAKGQSGSITFRLSVLEDTSVTADTFVYEKFTGGQPSPNPDYPSPIESVGRKNIIKSLSSKWSSGINYNLDNSLIKKTMTFSCIIDASITSANLYIIPATGVSAISLGTINFTANQRATKTFNLTDEQIQVIKSNQGGIFQIYKSSAFESANITDAQLEKGTVATDYVPYEHTEISAEVTNANQWNNDLVINATKSTDGFTMTDKWVVPLMTQSNILNTFKPDTTYTIKVVSKVLSKPTTLAPNHIGYDILLYKRTPWSAFVLNNYDKTNAKVGDINTTYTTITTPSDLHDFNLSGYCFFGNNDGSTTYKGSGSIEIQQIMLAEGEYTKDNFPDYVHYASNSLTIDLQGNELCSLPNGTKDEVNITNGEALLIKRIGKVVLDGSESWSITTPTHDGFTRYSVSAPAIKGQNLAISSHFIVGDTTSTSVTNLLEYRDTNYIFINTNVAENLSGFKSWLSTHNVEVLYELAEPETINLGTVEMPHTYEGVSNITNSADTEMVVKYYKKFEFDKILRSGYNIDEQEYEIAKKQMANGKRKKILSSYVDCIIKIDLGLLDNKTYQEYKEQLEDGEYEYWSYKYNQYKKANFILTKPSITTEYAYDDEIGIDDMEITLEKSSDVS